MHAQEFAKAANVLEGLTRLKDEYASAFVNLGIAYLSLGRGAEAGAAFRKAIRKDPSNAAAYNELGILYRRNARFPEARQAYENALALRPDYSVAHLNLGILCDLYLQDEHCALRHYERYQEFSSVVDERITLWIADLKRRINTKKLSAKSSGEYKTRR